MEDQLEAFRREWLLETQQNKTKRTQQPSQRPHPHPHPPAAAPANSARPPLSPPTHTQANLASSPPSSQFDLLQIKAEEASEVAFSPQTALDHYTLAVQAEKEGRLNDALTAYRTAFRLDPEADRAYHRATLPKTNTRTNDPAPLSDLHNIPHTNGKLPGPSGAEWKFERQLHLGPDYVPTTLDPVEDKDHPSSTSAYINTLAQSFGKHPWVRPKPAVGEAAPNGDGLAEDPKPEVVSADDALERLHFIQADEEQPLPLASLPREVLLLILQHLSLSSVLPPAAKHGSHPEEHAATSTALAGRRGKREIKRTLRDEMRIAEDELGLEEAQFGWKMDVEALERFARSCRAARILTLDTVLWRELCLRAYVAPHQIRPEDSAAALAQEQHAGDWRRCFIEHPRVRLDGVFISVVTYLRSGEAQAWHSATHLITFYRYLRFFPSGMVISFLTTDAPTAVVRKLNASLRAKGVTFGKWRLRGSEIECWGLEDPGVKESERKYSFRMNLRLKSTQRGRMNKLEMLELATEHRSTGELEQIPIRPTKPFLFSKVNNYAAEDW